MLAIREAYANQRELPNKRSKASRGLKAILGKHTKEELIDLICAFSREYNLRGEIAQYFEEDAWD